MAVYTTFFLCEPELLAAGFSGWRPPLPKPIRREFKNPFTGKLTVRETREPDWSDLRDLVPEPEYQVVSGTGRYEEYLEGRLRPFVRGCLHWAGKGVSLLETAALGQAVGIETKLEAPLYAPPSTSAGLVEVPPQFISQLAMLGDDGQMEIAEKWAAIMSSPEHTHSVGGEKLNDGWKRDEAIAFLQPISALARKAQDRHRMYLLIEF
jgi:hypothetical protein